MFSKLSGRVRGRKGLIAAIAAATVTVAVPAAAALFYVYPQYTWPLAKPYSVHAADWWKWLIAQPADTNPLLDTTGEHCDEGQSGLVWYLAGSPDSTPVVRNCTIPYGRTLVFPVVNAAYFAFEEDPPETKTEEFLRSQVEFVEDAQNLAVEIDGVSVPNVERFLEKSILFGTTTPADNIYGLPEGFVLEPAVDSGYYLAVAPLLPGTHKVHFHGELDGYVVDVTYNLKIKASFF